MIIAGPKEGELPPMVSPNLSLAYSLYKHELYGSKAKMCSQIMIKDLAFDMALLIFSRCQEIPKVYHCAL